MGQESMSNVVESPVRPCLGLVLSARLLQSLHE